jgi:hypothetical protein
MTQKLQTPQGETIYLDHPARTPGSEGSFLKEAYATGLRPLFFPRFTKPIKNAL